MEIREGMDFSKVADMLESLKTEDLYVQAIKSDINKVFTVIFVCKEYSLGLWFTRSGLTIHEYGFNSIPIQFFKIEDIERIEQTEAGFRVVFKKGYQRNGKDYPFFEINTGDLKKSVFF